MRRIALLAAASFLATGGAQAQVTQAPGVGVVAFANSGAPHAQRAFQRGVALLHNFEYPRAIAAFQEAQKADPGFAMAYWGEAMAHNHPIWMAQDLEAGRAALAKLGPDRGARLAKAATDRERGFLEAVETLYGDGTKQDRDRAYSARMEALYRAYPRDVDVASFYALSLLGLAHEGRDYWLYMRAAATLEELFPQNPHHPGVLHYLIHSYDDPTHAPLGLRAARLYGAVAPDAPHALHMTSHIFIAMGDWQQTIAANEAATAAAARLRQAQGLPPAACGHGLEWLNYAYYQVGQPEKSDRIRAACRAAAASEAAGGKSPYPFSALRSYADKWVRSIVEGQGRHTEPPLSVEAERGRDTAFTFAYGALLQARGNAAQIAAIRRQLAKAAATPGSDNVHPLTVKRQQIILQQAEGLEALASGRREQGLAALKKAAELERVMAPDFGPPLVEKPSFELLAEELMAAGRASEAAQAYRTALRMAPGRKLTQSGLALAEKAQHGATAAAAHKR